MADAIIEAKDRLTAAGEALERLRDAAPRVHCLTNAAAANLTANGLLALGATPSLSDHIDEVAAFTESAGALSVNLGTPDDARLAAIDLAVAAAGENGIPWVLDPVMIDRAPARRKAAARLVGRGPAVLRLNEVERTCLFDGADAPTFDGVLAVSGARDRLIRDGQEIGLQNGHPLMARMTGAGCLLGAVTAAFLAVEEDALAAALAAAVTLGVAGELAAREAHWPGSFQPALLDRIYALTPRDILERGRVQCAG